jgi:hypothetical protein
MKKNAIFNCPHCGAEIKANAVACPECVSDEITGWSTQIYLDGIDLADEESYEEIRQNEFGNRGHSTRGEQNSRLWIWVTGIVVLGAMIGGVVLNLHLH